MHFAHPMEDGLFVEMSFEFITPFNNRVSISFEQGRGFSPSLAFNKQDSPCVVSCSY